MSRYCGDRDSTALLEAADLWRETCLLSDEGSVFALGPIWNSENFQHLTTHYVENLDEGEGNFFSKLEGQLVEAPREAKLLCAELMWLLLLCPSNVKPPKKRENITHVAALAGEKLPSDHPMLNDAVLTGVGSAGTAYNNHRWRELVYAITLFGDFFERSIDERKVMLADRDSFAIWLESIEGTDQRQFRHMLVFILFPDSSERSFSSQQRRSLLAAFRGRRPRDYGNLTALEMDHQLATLRSEQETEYGTDKLDWYVPPLKAFWLETSKLGEHEPGRSFYSVLETFLAQSLSQSLATKDYPSSYGGFTVRVSFGVGNQAHVTWIAFLGPDQTPMKGIYPVYLYFKADNRLVLARGISAANKPDLEWQGEELVTIDESFVSELGHKAIRYGDSFVFADYDLSEELDEEQLNQDLAALLAEYSDLLSVRVQKDPTTNYPPRGESKPGVVKEELYSIYNALEDLFISENQVEQILALLETKRNIVLQGPPGTGKSFASKRLAYALMGAKSDDRVEMVQFHQSYAYEDFIQGYRPSDSGFELQQGIFYQFCEKAADNPKQKYVFIIDEINRGNLSKIFGELMLLVEADKRGPNWQIPLTYSKDIGEKFFIPENLYLIGLMNTADRSLAMVDFALRRRFAFFNLTPKIESEAFHRDLKARGADDAMIAKLTSRMGALNERIANDALNLGPGFCIGHSFFCGESPTGLYDDLWFEQIVRFEIEPLIREYWFDDPQAADAIITELLI